MEALRKIDGKIFTISDTHVVNSNFVKGNNRIIKTFNIRNGSVI